MWMPPEDKDPVVKHAPTRKSVSMFGAVNLHSGKLVTMRAPVFNAETFQDFLRKLLRHCKKSRRMVVTLDNARYHHTQMLADLLRDYFMTLSLDFLPPYSPELNMIKRVWKLLRRLATHNQYFENLEVLVLAVSSQVDLWRKPNPILTKLCRII